MGNEGKIILDLCGGTGSWSKPYREAGYDVRLVTWPENDVRTYEPPEGVYGILAAPPCTMFSMARTTAKTPRDMKTAMEIVAACLRIIWRCQQDGTRLKFWAMENPSARLRWFMGIPAPTFNPYEFGDPHRKPTDIWGNFNTNLKRNPVEIDPHQRKQTHMTMKQLPELPSGFKTPPDMTRRSSARSITPNGFAKAFMEANK